MNFIDILKKRHTLSTEELLNELSLRLDLDGDNQNIFSVLGMVMLAHSGDSRRRDDSCVNHILRVTLMAGDLSENSEQMILLGLLHDIVEDYPDYITGPVQDLWIQLEKDYGKKVSSALDALTNPPAVEEEEKGRHHTPVLYHEHLKHTLKNEDAALVKLADFTDNLMTVFLSDDKEWQEELNRRYYPVINLFEEAFADKDYVENLRDYFSFVQGKN